LAVREGLDVAVIGGGLVGAACAYELARDGHRVTVFDRRDPGRATDAGAGILSPETMGGMPAPFLDLADLAGAHYPPLLAALAELGAPDPRYAVCGALRVAVRELDDRYYAANVDASRARHPGVLETVTPEDARRLFPPLGEVRAATLNPRGARVDGRALVAALEFATGALGVDWRNEPAPPIATIAADVVVIAGGAWTPSLAAEFGLATGIRPERGQVVHLQTGVDTRAWPVLQPILSHYVVPWSDGRVALRATHEDVGFDVRTTAGGLRQLCSEGLRVSPGLADATFLEVRVGLRPVSDDDLPVIGWLLGADRLYVAAGHGANGLLLGPVTGRVVADAVGGRRLPLDLTPFAPERFS
jgi:D-amino-acid dehydrogenase